MSNKTRALSVAALLVLLLLVACTSVRAESQAVPASTLQEAQRAITVVGIGRINLVPNVAKINVGAEVRASSVSEAKGAVDRRMEAITAALKELGVAEKDIQTSQYSIFYEQEPYQPSVREEGATAEPKGAYRVSSMLEVTVRDVERAGAVLDGVVAAGANQMYGVNFTVADDHKWQSEAREKAVADAKARAQELARLAGVELGEVLSVSEVIGSGSGYTAWAERGMGGGGGGIAPGELEMSTQVQVTFAIR